MASVAEVTRWLPPPPGQRGVVTVTDVAQVAGEPSDIRRGYLVGYRCVHVPAGMADPAAADPAFAAARQTRYLLLARQFDGHWLVAADTGARPLGEPRARCAAKPARETPRPRPVR